MQPIRLLETNRTMFEYEYACPTLNSISLFLINSIGKDSTNLLEYRNTSLIYMYINKIKFENIKFKNCVILYPIQV